MTRTTHRQPSTEPYLPGGADPLPWADATHRLAEAGTLWLATTAPEGRPHVAPVLSVWVAGAPHFAASPASRKARNLAIDPRCVVTTSEGGLDLVVEGTAERVTDDADLRAVAGAYAEQHGWPVEIRDGAVHAEGAPTAGSPPYAVYRVDPTVAFGFPTEGDLPPTRWRF